jgi:hypothetical protein
MVSALNVAAAGLFNSQQSFNNSAVQFINSFTPVLGASSGDGQAIQQISQLPVEPGTNPFAGTPISGETLVAASTAQLFSPSATDPTQALFNLLQSGTAFSANIAAFSRISEVEDSLLDIMA